jgi:hypothetical protein
MSSTEIQSTQARSIPPALESALFLRREQAANYLAAKYGFGSKRTLAKLACVGGGPLFHKSGRLALYRPTDLDAWALSRIGAARKSTSDI